MDQMTMTMDQRTERTLSSMTVGRLIQALSKYPAETVIDFDLLNLDGEVAGVAAYAAVEFEADRCDVPSDPPGDRLEYPHVVLVIAHPDV